MRMTFVRKVGRVILALLALTAITVGIAYAEDLGSAFMMDKAQVVVFAPHTVWQGTNAHVVVKITNTGGEPVSDFKATLTLPGDAKGYNLPKTFTNTLSFKDAVKPGETKYLSFTYVRPKTSMALGDYKGAVTVKTGAKEVTLDWPVSIREGTRYHATTGMIVVLILAISLATMIWWFIYFKVWVNPAFVFFKSWPEAIVAILVIVLFFGANLVMAFK